MNIPEHILQQVADAAFLSSNGGMMGLLTCNKEKNHVFWHEERYARLAVIQHALDNPALAPFLSKADAKADLNAELAKTYDLARQLERELAAMTALADRLAETLKDCKNRAMDKSIETHPDEHTKGCIDDIWEWAEEALAVYEKHKKQTP